MSRFAAIWTALVATALGSSAWAGEATHVRIDELAPRDRLEIHTAKYVIRLDIVDPATGEARASFSSDGKIFGQTNRVFVLGATKGRHPEGLMVVHMRQLEVGKGIEIGLRNMDAENRRITEPVQSFKLTPAVSNKIAANWQTRDMN